MTSIKQSVAWWCYVPAKLTPERFVQAVAEAGYDAIDLVPPDYLPLVRAHGLAISAIAGHHSLTRGLNQPDQHDRIASEVRTNIALAVQWAIPNLICFSGNRNGLDDLTGIRNTAAGLARLAPDAEAAGVTLLLELLNSKVDHRDYQADHTAWGVQVCQRVASAHVKLLYDIYHMQIMEGDIIRTIEAAHSVIGHCHTAGNPGRHDLDETQELHYPAILHAIRASDYRGYVAHEFIPRGDPVAALHATRQNCAAYLSDTRV